ncbi:hypothetical protein DFJ74DRAFT_675051 [Hyaloraphidium curvatum]|nr:hypothetical protein DFJ74DRAFT_675051 [Hyaloraphidium curvatum]
MFSLLRQRVLAAGAAPVLVAAAEGNVDLLREIVPLPDDPERVDRLAALGVATFFEPDLRASFVGRVGWSATDVAAAGGHVGFLAAWEEQVGPFALENAFVAALVCFADTTLAWMLEKAAGLSDGAAPGTWLGSLRNQAAAKWYLLCLARGDYEMHEERWPDRVLDDSELEASKEACRRCYRTLFERLFTGFATYPTIEDQFLEGSVETALLFSGGLVTYGSIDDPKTRRECHAWFGDEKIGDWFHPTLFEMMLDEGVIVADDDLLTTCVGFGGGMAMYYTDGGPVGGEFPGRRHLFLCLHLVFRRASAAGFPPTAEHLAWLLSSIYESEAPHRCLRSLVLLLLFYEGPKPGERLDRSTKENAEKRYRGLVEDVLEVARWRRWIDRGSLGGLPPELTQEIMFRTWIEMLR